MKYFALSVALFLAAAAVANLAKLQSIVINPPSLTVSVGKVARLTAIGKYDSGPSRNLSDDVGWTSSDTAIVKIFADGTVHAFAPGAVTVTANLGSIVSEPATVNVK